MAGDSTAKQQSHWAKVRKILLPGPQAQVPDGTRPTDRALSRRRSQVVGHGASTLLLMVATAASVPALVVVVAIPLHGSATGELAQAGQAIYDLRSARASDQNGLMLQLVAGILISSFFLVFKAPPQTRVSPCDTGSDPFGEKTFLGILLGTLLLLGVLGASWVALPPEGEPVDWSVVIIGLLMAYLCAAVARLVLSDHVRALQWSHEQWDEWARIQANRAAALRRDGVRALDWQSAMLATSYLLVPASLVAFGMVSATGVRLLATWTMFALLPASLVAGEIVAARAKRVSRRWSGLIAARLIVVPMLLILAMLILDWSEVGYALRALWFASLWYGYNNVKKRFRGSLDLWHLDFGTPKAATTPGATKAPRKASTLSMLTDRHTS